MKTLKLISTLLFCNVILQLQAQDVRYLDSVFQSVKLTKNIVYAENYSVFPDPSNPFLQELKFDFYEPADDTEIKRPLIILLHTGDFLPQQINGYPWGTKEDFPIVEIANRLAQSGYTAAIVDYRLGWNPLASSIKGRKEGYLNATYRGVQDANTAVRFFKKDADTENNYRIDSERITLWGMGEGAEITLAASTAKAYEDWLFNDPDSMDLYIDEALSGNPSGEMKAPLNNPNHIGYDNQTRLCVNMGGGVLDTAWIDATDTPFINFHCPKDPFTPYKEAELIIPTTGELIVKLFGSYRVAEQAQAFGLNNVYNGFVFDADLTLNVPSPELLEATPYTQSAATTNDGLEGLFPLNRECVPPIIGSGEWCEHSPWNWWDSDYWSTVPHPLCPVGVPLDLCNFDVVARLNNQDASPEKGNIYIDSIMGYFAPRACVVLDLPCKEYFIDETSSTVHIVDIPIKTVPNPSKDVVLFTTPSNQPIQVIELYTLEGELVRVIKDIQSNSHELYRQGLASGMYIAKLRFKDGFTSKKIVFE